MEKYINLKAAIDVINNIDISKPWDDKEDIIEQAIGLVDHLPTMNVETLCVPQDGQAIVWKYKTTMDLYSINCTYESITKCFPNNTVVAIPDNTCLDVFNKKDLIKVLKDVINNLEENDENKGT